LLKSKVCETVSLVWRYYIIWITRYFQQSNQRTSSRRTKSSTTKEKTNWRNRSKNTTTNSAIHKL